MAKQVDINLVIKTAGSEKTIEEANQNLKDLKTTADALGGSFDNAFSQGLNNAINKTTDNLNKLTDAAKKGGEDIKDGFDNGKDGLENFDKVGIKTLGKLKKELALLITQQEGLDKGSQKFKELTEEIKKTQAAVERAEGAFGDASDTIKTLSGTRVERLKGSFGLLRESIVNLDFDKFKIGAKGVGDAIGGIGGAIKATGIGLLVGAVVALIANFDKLKTSGGVLGQVLTFIGDTVGKVVQGLKDFSDFLGLTNIKGQEAAQAQEKFGQAVREVNNDLGEARRKELVLTGKLTEEAAAKANAKEQFITDFLNAQETARKEIREAGTAAEKKIIEDRLKAELGLITQNYKNELIEIDKQSKEKTEAAKKEEADKAKEREKVRSDAAKAATQKQKEQEKAAREELAALAREQFLASLSEEERILNESNEKILALEKAFRDSNFKVGSDEEKQAQKQLQDSIAQIKLDTTNEVNELIRTREQEELKLIEEEQKASLERKLANAKKAEENVKAQRKLDLEEALAEAQVGEDATFEQQIQSLEKQKQLEIDNAEAIGESTLEVEKKYNDQIAKLRQARIQKGFDTAKAAAGALGALNDLLTSRENRNANLSEKEKEKIRQKQFKRDKALALVNTAIATGEAIAKASPNPLLIAFAAVTGAAQLAAIASKKYNPDATNETAPDTPTTPTTEDGGGLAPAAQLTQLGALASPTAVNNRVFVVESDITNTINKVQVAENQSKFG
jgi:hypothetical protein